MYVVVCDSSELCIVTHITVINNITPELVQAARRAPRPNRTLRSTGWIAHGTTATGAHRSRIKPMADPILRSPKKFSNASPGSHDPALPVSIK